MVFNADLFIHMSWWIVVYESKMAPSSPKHKTLGPRAIRVVKNARSRPFSCHGCHCINVSVMRALFTFSNDFSLLLFLKYFYRSLNDDVGFKIICGTNLAHFPASISKREGSKCRELRSAEGAVSPVVIYLERQRRDLEKTAFRAFWRSDGRGGSGNFFFSWKYADGHSPKGGGSRTHGIPCFPAPFENRLRNMDRINYFLIPTVKELVWFFLMNREDSITRSEFDLWWAETLDSTSDCHL